MLRPPLESHDISRNVRDNLEATAEPMHARGYSYPLWTNRSDRKVPHNGYVTAKKQLHGGERGE